MENIRKYGEIQMITSVGDYRRYDPDRGNDFYTRLMMYDLGKGKKFFIGVRDDCELE